MRNTEDDGGSGEEEISEARTDFRRLRDADSTELRSQTAGETRVRRGRGETTRGWEVGVRCYKLGKSE